MALEFADTLASARADEITAAIDAGASGGLIRLYNGTRPAKGGTATTLLAELTFSATSSPAASAGVITASAITGDASANATSTATWFRVLDSNAVFRFDGDVGTSGSDLNLNDVNIVSGNPVDITSWVITDGNL